MSTAATLIENLPLWALLTLSAVCGAAIAGVGALIFDRYADERQGDREGGDLLTGVGSRREFVRELESAWSETQDQGGDFGILVVDVDGFGDINHVYGRAVGDRVLSEVAERIRLRVRGRDFVGRIDADEFGVVCRDASPEALDSIRVNLEAYINLAQSVPVSLSIGVATPEKFDESSLDLLSRARMSLRQRREARPERVVDEALAALLLPR